PVSLTINEVPVLSNAALSLCDLDHNGIETFNLLLASDQFSQDISLDYSFYLSQEDALNQINALNTTYELNEPSRTLFVRAESPQSCLNFTELLLTINPVLNLNLNPTPARCMGENNGQLDLDLLSEESGWEFSLDQTIWQTDTLFTDLATGPYTLYARNNLCEFERSFEIFDGLMMDFTLFEIRCDDNGTQSDPSDDFYYVYFNLLQNRNAIYFFNLFVNGLDNGRFEFEKLDSIQLPANGDELIIEFIDESTNCKLEQTIGPLNPCSTTCTLELLQLDVNCDGNNTPSDPSDDFYTIEVNASASNGSTSFNILIDGNPSYNFNYNQGGSFTLPADGASPQIIIVDSNDEQCFVSRGIGPLNPCSDACTISATFANIQCFNADTPEDNSDDQFTFDLFVMGENVGQTWLIEGRSLTGNYGDSTLLGPFNIADGTQTLNIVDI
ncbi:MAG: hypothetical protein AAGK97_14450, partial [Bacteroidota bacterium]